MGSINEMLSICERSLDRALLLQELPCLEKSA